MKGGVWRRRRERCPRHASPLDRGRPGDHLVMCRRGETHLSERTAGRHGWEERRLPRLAGRLRSPRRWPERAASRRPSAAQSGASFGNMRNCPAPASSSPLPTAMPFGRLVFVRACPKSEPHPAADSTAVAEVRRRDCFARPRRSGAQGAAERRMRPVVGGKVSTVTTLPSGRL